MVNKDEKSLRPSDLCMYRGSVRVDIRDCTYSWSYRLDWYIDRVGRYPLPPHTHSRLTTYSIVQSQEHHGLLASLWKGQVVPIEVFPAPGSISSRGGPSPCHRRRVATTTWLASSKIHLAESDRWGRSAPELWGPHVRGRQRKGMLGIKSSVWQRSVRSSPIRRRRIAQNPRNFPVDSLVDGLQSPVDWQPVGDKLPTCRQLVANKSL